MSTISRRSLASVVALACGVVVASAPPVQASKAAAGAATPATTYSHAYVRAPAPYSASIPTPYAISDRSVVVASVGVDGQTWGFQWKKGRSTWLTRTVSGVATSTAYAKDINRSGEMVGVALIADARRPVLWKSPSSAKVLPLSSGDQRVARIGLAEAINRKGEAVGTAWTTDGTSIAQVWDHKGRVSAVSVAGADVAGIDIADDGTALLSVAVKGDTSACQVRSALWRRGALTYLPSPEPCDGLSPMIQPQGISPSGRYVVANSYQARYVWRTDTRVVDWWLSGGAVTARDVSDAGVVAGSDEWAATLTYKTTDAPDVGTGNGSWVDLSQPDAVPGLNGTPHEAVALNSLGQVLVRLWPEPYDGKETGTVVLTPRD